jgi:hypothetical protein
VLTEPIINHQKHVDPVRGGLHIAYTGHLVDFSHYKHVSGLGFRAQWSRNISPTYSYRDSERNTKKKLLHHRAHKNMKE